MCVIQCKLAYSAVSGRLHLTVDAVDGVHGSTKVSQIEWRWLRIFASVCFVSVVVVVVIPPMVLGKLGLYKTTYRVDISLAFSGNYY